MTVQAGSGRRVQTGKVEIAIVRLFMRRTRIEEAIRTASAEACIGICASTFIVVSVRAGLDWLHGGVCAKGEVTSVR